MFVDLFYNKLTYLLLQSVMSASHQQAGGTRRSNESVYYVSVRKIMSQISPSTLRQFHQQSTDDDRFAFISALPGVRSALTASSPIAAVDKTGGKSSEEARRHRQNGNELYKAEQLREALASYTASVLVAPVTDCDCNDDNGAEMDEVEKANSEFVLALGNRSACLLQMKRYDECQTDIALALRCGYPRHLRYKLYDRQARALIDLGRYDEALEALRKLHSSLSLTTLEPNQRSTIERNAEKKMDFCNSAVVQPPAPKDEAGSLTTDNNRLNVPAISGANNERYPGASDAFDVRYHQDKGRYAVASRDVVVGEILLVELPYVSVLSDDAYEARCYNCFRNLGDIPQGCRTCNRVR